MHPQLRLLDEIRPLRDPVFLAAFVGWTDTHGAAAATIDYLAEQWNATPLAQIEPEPFFDFTVQRPRTRNTPTGRATDWPRNWFLVASPPDSERDFVLFSGIEPHMRWRSFLEAMFEVVRATHTTESVTLGTQPGAVPHTRPLPVTLSASDERFEEQFGLKIPQSRYEGPTGLLSVLNLRLRAEQWRNASLWALVPHYLNVGPNPNAMVSLIKTLNRGYGLQTSTDGLERKLAEFDEQLREGLEPGSEAATYIATLEEQYDSSRSGDPADNQPPAGELPSSEELLGDLDEFFRGLRGGEGQQP